MFSIHAVTDRDDTLDTQSLLYSNAGPSRLISKSFHTWLKLSVAHMKPLTDNIIYNSASLAVAEAYYLLALQSV